MTKAALRKISSYGCVQLLSCSAEDVTNEALLNLYYQRLQLVSVILYFHPISNSLLPSGKTALMTTSCCGFGSILASCSFHFSVLIGLCVVVLAIADRFSITCLYSFKQQNMQDQREHGVSFSSLSGYWAQTPGCNY